MTAEINNCHVYNVVPCPLKLHLPKKQACELEAVLYQRIEIVNREGEFLVATKLVGKQLGLVLLT